MICTGDSGNGEEKGGTRGNSKVYGLNYWLMVTFADVEDQSRRLFACGKPKVKSHDFTKHSIGYVKQRNKAGTQRIGIR